MFGCLGLGSAFEESKPKSLRFSSFLFGVPLTKIPKKEGGTKTTYNYLSPQPREKKKPPRSNFPTFEV